MRDDQQPVPASEEGGHADSDRLPRRRLLQALGGAAGLATIGFPESGPVGGSRAQSDGPESPVELSLEAPGTVQPGETLTVTAEVTNRDVPEASSGLVELTSVPEPLAVTSDTDNPAFLGVPSGTPVPAVGESVTQQFALAVSEDTSTGEDVTLAAEARLQNDTATPSTTTTRTVTVAEQQDPVDRFDTNDQPGIQRDEVVDAIVAFNTETEIGGEAVSRSDVVDVIVAFNNQ